MTVFLDTNVWLSATIFPGLCEPLVMACAERDWLLTSPLVQRGSAPGAGTQVPAPDGRVGPLEF